MTRPEDSVSEAEIEAFVIGQLDADRRFAVADHLARHPDLAARVMSDLRMHEGLRLTFAGADRPPPPELRQAATRLSRGLVRPSPWPLWTIAAVALVASGWIGQSLWTGLVDMRTLADLRPFAETALDARAAVDLRRSLSIVPARIDSAQVAARLGITLPRLPSDWQVRDVQVVATPDLPGLAVVIDTPDMGEVMLLTFPQRDRIANERPPMAFDHRGAAVAVFGHGSAAYVLLDASAGEVADVSREAARLLSRLN